MVTMVINTLLLLTINYMILKPQEISPKLMYAKIPENQKAIYPKNPWIWSKTDIVYKSSNIYPKANPKNIKSISSYILTHKKYPYLDMVSIFVIEFKKFGFKSEIQKLKNLYNENPNKARLVAKEPIAILIITNYNVVNLIDKIKNIYEKKLQNIK